MRITILILLILVNSALIFPQAISWQIANAPNKGSVFCLAKDSTSVVYLGTERGGIFRSTDNGQTWSTITSNPPELNIRALACGNKDRTIIAGSSTGKIYLSRNSGASWSLQGDLRAQITDIEILATNRVIATIYDYYIYQSTDYGTSWVKVPTDWGFFYLPSAIAGLPDGNCLIVSEGSSSINYSDFSELSESSQWHGWGLAGSSKSITLDPLGYFYYGRGSNLRRGKAVYYSQKQFYPTTEMDQRVLPDVEWSSIISNQTGRLFVGTSGRGIYQSMTHGESWAQCSSGLLSDTILTLMPLSDGSLVAGASDGKVYRSVQSSLVLLPPLPLSPSQNSVNLLSPVSLQWRKAFGADRYRIQVSTEIRFASGIVLDSVVENDTSALFGGLKDLQNYYWRVRSENSSEISIYSNPWKFVSGPPAPPPVLCSPFQGSTNMPVNSIAFQWNAVPKATEYWLVVSGDSNSANIVWSLTTMDTSAVVKALSSNYNLYYQTQYYWSVTTRSGAGSSKPSQAWSFTTVEAPPQYCYLSTPANDVRELPTTVTFTWSAGTGARWYHLQVATDKNFQSGMAFSDSLLASTSKTVSGLKYDTKYYWRVIPWNYGGVGTQTGYYVFTTTSPAPDSSILKTPSDRAVNQPTMIDFQWSTAIRASWYTLVISSDSSFPSNMSNSLNVTDTTTTIYGFTNSAQYYWKILPGNNAGVCTHGQAFSFRTVIASPPAPMVLFPENYSTNEILDGVLVWSSSPNADSYILKITTDTLEWTNSGETIVLTDTVYRRTFEKNTNYYWRVAANNALGGRSYWSKMMRFRTSSYNDVIRQDIIIPTKLDISQNYPNPFNSETNFVVSLPQTTDVRIEVFSSHGMLVSTLLSHPLPSGVFKFVWKSSNLASGVYFYRLRANNVSLTKKMILLK